MQSRGRCWPREEVRALGRDEGRLAGLAAAGAEVRTGDVSDAGFLAEAFRGADAVYTLIPVDARADDFHAAQAQVGTAIVKALAEAGVKHVVALSSIGAELPSGTGVLAALHAQEERLRSLTGANVLLLRPGSFFENFEAMKGLIEAAGDPRRSGRPRRVLPHDRDGRHRCRSRAGTRGARLEGRRRARAARRA